MNRGRKVAIAAAVAAVAMAAGTGIAVAGGSGDAKDQQPITGSELEHASRVALAETGGGSVTATELQDEEGYYEVEVKLDSGKSVDVHLDKSFNVIDSKGDGGNQQDESQG